jgi:hypothetical protein
VQARICFFKNDRKRTLAVDIAIDRHRCPSYADLKNWAGIPLKLPKNTNPGGNAVRENKLAPVVQKFGQRENFSISLEAASHPQRRVV